MAHISYIQIDSFNSEDINDMIEEIAKIQKTTTTDIKKVILDMANEKPGYIEQYKFTLVDLLKILKFYDFPFKFRVEYLSESQANEDSKKKYINEITEEPKPKDISLLERQMGEINPELLEEVNAPAEVKLTPCQKHDIDPDEIPDFN